MPTILLNLLLILLNTKRIVLTVASDTDLGSGSGLFLLRLELVYVDLALVGLLEELVDQLELLVEAGLVFGREFLLRLFLLVLH